MGLREEKAALRSEIRAKMKQLAEADRKRWDEEITRRVLALPEYQKAHKVFCFVGVGAEIDTAGILADIFKSGKRLCVPRCKSGGHMDACTIKSVEELKPAPFGLLEPDETAPVVACGDVDLILAPCLAASREGLRLGQGGGFYDRYLTENNAPIVCLCREVFLYETLPMEDFDQRVDLVVSEEAVYDNRT